MGDCNDKWDSVNREYLLKNGSLLKIYLVDSSGSSGFGEWVKELRERARLSQADLAQLMSVASTYVSRVETGDRPATEPFAISFARAMKLPLTDVLVKAGFWSKDASPAESEARRKINALIDMLSPEEQEQAIEILETFRKRREAEIKAASQRKLKRN